jgi:hypothetical protein
VFSFSDMKQDMIALYDLDQPPSSGPGGMLV